MESVIMMGKREKRIKWENEVKHLTLRKKERKKERKTDKKS